MKKVASFVLFYFIASHSFSQNLAVNAGFETWQKINKPAGWTTALACTKDSVIIRTGFYSCRQNTTTESKELGQVLTVQPGLQYNISFWYRNDPSAAGNGCRIWSNWKDADGNSITDDTSLPYLHSGYLKSDSWKQYTAEVTAPANAFFLNLVFRTLPNSITYWDDIVFGESIPTGISEQNTDNILIHPNPASSYLNISNIQNVQQIDIQTITGIRMVSFIIDGEKNITVSLSGYKNGIYIICLYSNGNIRFKKFIKVSE
ncbi:MAG: T9SS type A sorting domain-containing protein [Bacteroidia bacterium]|nr:T9SS type A sorting domain-containing protein [Bacteroidia bacterium]